jgi:hypothetical protein
MKRTSLPPPPPRSTSCRENWPDKLELGGSKSGYVACYAANQILSDIGARDVVEAMLAPRW